jgi:hypothetical protein
LEKPNSGLSSQSYLNDNALRWMVTTSELEATGQEFGELPRGVLSNARYQDVGSLEPIWSFNSHLPVLTGSCSSDGHTPVATSVSECVFDVRSDFLAKLSLPEILQLKW